MSKDNTADAFILENTPPFGEGLSHGFFEEDTVFGTAIHVFRRILHDLSTLGSECICWIKRVLEQRMAG
jgi:hypothetical protein